MANHILIEPDEHVFIAGKTGCGKTFLGRKYLAGYENVVCLDTKGTLEWPEIPRKYLTVCTHLEELPSVKTPKIIYKPCKEEMNQESYELFFSWIYDRQNTIVWIDELMGVCESYKTYPQSLKDCLTRGRELYVAVWSMTQRPTDIPVLAITEATHNFVFLLTAFQDRDKIAKNTGCMEIREKPGRQSERLAWYYNVNHESPVKIRLKEGR